MKTSWKTALAYVGQSEGGFTDHPADRGGPTNFGVTERVYNSWRRRKGLPPRSVRLIEKAEVEAIFREQYWAPVRADELPVGVDYAVFDAAVHHGVSGAAQLLQQAINALSPRKIAADGQVGAITLDLAGDVEAEALIDTMLDARIDYMKTRDGWAVFEDGWRNRVTDVRNRARAMLMLAPKSPPMQKPPLPEGAPTAPPDATTGNPAPIILALLLAVAAVVGRYLGLI